jgi:hypothetical protein
VIDFRYHLVSIIAVFLALAIGLVIGANVLPVATEAALRGLARNVTRDNTRLTQQKQILQQQVNADQAFAQAASRPLLDRLLTGQSVVLVLSPNSNNQVVSGVTAAVQLAGGTVTGRLALQPQFFDPSESAESKLQQLAQSLAPQANVTLPAQSASDPVVGQEQAAQVIAAAVVSNADGVGLSAAQSQAVLGGFGQSGYLTISTASNSNATSLPSATMAIVVAPSSPPTSNDSSPANLALIQVAEKFQAATRRTVLVGSLAGSGPGSAIDAVVSGSGKVSTVDNADLPSGQIMTVQTLWELLRGKAPASYGVGTGTAPSPAPTPSQSPTSSVSPTSHSSSSTTTKSSPSPQVSKSP